MTEVVAALAEGWTVQLPDDVTDVLMKRTDPTWPCTWFTPRCDGVDGSAFGGCLQRNEKLGR